MSTDSPHPFEGRANGVWRVVQIQPVEGRVLSYHKRKATAVIAARKARNASWTGLSCRDDFRIDELVWGVWQTRLSNVREF